MTQGTDDFEEDFEDATVQRAQPPRPSMASNLKAAWQGSPLFKMFILVVVVAALAAAAIAIFSSSEKDISPTNVKGAPTLTEAPGSKAPPAYVDAVNDASQKRADEALQQGRSALPTPVSGDENKAGLGDEADQSQYDPLAEFRPNVPQDAVQSQAPDAAPVDPVDSDLLGKMQSQMTALFESWRPAGIKNVQVIDPASLLKNVSATTTTGQAAGRVIISAGSIYYGVLLLEANSDAPGPIMAEVMSGPFTGGRLVGHFEVTREYLVIRFTKLTYRKKDYSIDVLAVDPNTTLGGMVTEKDSRYFTRIVLPSAAAFLEGFGQALSSPSNRVVTDSGNVLVFNESKKGLEDGLYRGISAAAGTVSGFLRDEAAATKPLIRVAAGTPMGLFFVNSVAENTAQGSNAIIQTPVDNSSRNQFALPQSSSGSGGGSLTPVTTDISSPSQSSLANGGVNIIQNTPGR